VSKASKVERSDLLGAAVIVQEGDSDLEDDKDIANGIHGENKQVAPAPSRVKKRHQTAPPKEIPDNRPMSKEDRKKAKKERRKDDQRAKALAAQQAAEN